MKITHIYAENYKTYRRLDLDLNVTEDRPIILVGGGNGCGKTTLFDAIYHALYGLEIKTVRNFEELFNNGVAIEQGIENKSIVLEISFTGVVAGQTSPFKLKRIYKYMEGEVRWNVELNMNGSKFTYGIATPATQRSTIEETVNKIIAANLPSELSNYFLFDAMKTSDLVKEEQINKLIMKNINSVMGFNKYAAMKSASETLLAERKAAKLENEKLRAEYEELGKKKQSKEAELNQLKEDYGKALEFSNENKERYNTIKEGRNNDDMIRDRASVLKSSIEDIEKRALEYRKNMDSVMKDMELNILYPNLASRLKTEIEIIINEKKKIAEARGEEISGEQLTEITHSLIVLLKDKYGYDIDVEEEELVRKLKSNDKHGDKLNEKYPYLSDVDVDNLTELIKNSYSNPFIALDDNKYSLNLDISELPKKKAQLVEFNKALKGVDYSIIASYEDNENRIREMKQSIDTLTNEIKTLSDRIAQFDYDIPQVPDPQYDMLCKLPDFFKNLSAKLLASKRSNIENRLREQLNINLVVYSGYIGRVDLSGDGNNDICFKMYHKNGNEIYLSQLNAGAKQTVMQVLLKVLYELGDYNPPVMIDTVMGVLDKESREVILERYFPDLAHQTILLSTDTEITAENDFKKIEPFVAKTYTLHRDKEKQCTNITENYFGLTIND